MIFSDYINIEKMELLADEVQIARHKSGQDCVGTLFASPTVRLQFERMAECAGGNKSDRYFDVQPTEHPEQTALKWVCDGV